MHSINRTAVRNIDRNLSLQLGSSWLQQETVFGPLRRPDYAKAALPLQSMAVGPNWVDSNRPNELRVNAAAIVLVQFLKRLGNLTLCDSDVVEDSENPRQTAGGDGDLTQRFTTSASERSISFCASLHSGGWTCCYHRRSQPHLLATRIGPRAERQYHQQLAPGAVGGVCSLLEDLS